MKVVDPFPDVPVGVTTAAAAAEAAGLHGALVAPALWELGVGAYELLKEEIRMNKDVLAVVKEEINNRKKRAGSPEMAESAAAFA
jgi:hypothetical protein